MSIEISLRDLLINVVIFQSNKIPLFFRFLCTQNKDTTVWKTRSFLTGWSKRLRSVHLLFRDDPSGVRTSLQVRRVEHQVENVVDKTAKSETGSIM